MGIQVQPCCCPDSGIETDCCASVPESLSGTITSDNGDLDGKSITLTYDENEEFFPGSSDTGCWWGQVEADSTEFFGLKIYCTGAPAAFAGVTACKTSEIGSNSSEFIYFISAEDEDCGPFSVEFDDSGLQLSCSLFFATMAVTLA